MPGRAESDDRKRRNHVEITQKWMDKAVEMYKSEQEKSPGRERMGLRTVCEHMEEKCWTEDKTRISLQKSTLSRRLNNFQSQAQSNASKSWLTEGEADAVIAYANDLAIDGWPLSRRRIEEHAAEICTARYGEEFTGFGHNWIDRFISKHNDRLKGSWSRPLDNSRARASNPVAKEKYFDKLKTGLDGREGEEPLDPENLYGTDETGFQDGTGSREWVFGGPTKKFQHQQRNGGRENITVIVTICADGTSLPPAVIFKGEHFQTSWKQDNPLNASLGHSKKGYTDGEIGVEWIKDFDKKTKAKANGRRRLLLVDGHNSHYTRGFLEYARANSIRVLCYPSHSTHLYQGLDVVIFGPLKRSWSKFRDEFERKTSLAVGKTRFLAVYAQAHSEVLTKENILAAFKKTGVVPFNPDVITDEMLGPSRTTSTKSGMAIRLSSPVRVMTDMIHRVLARQAAAAAAAASEPDVEMISDVDEPGLEEPSLLSTPTRMALSELSSTSLSHLVSSSPPRSSSEMPLYEPYTISPFKSYNQDLLDLEPRTENEVRLQQALREAEERDRRRKNSMVTMQGVTMLQNMYVKQNNFHLHSREEEKKRKSAGNKLFGDGLPRFLDDDDFFFQVVKLDEEAKKKKAAKEERQVVREAHAQALAAWKQEEDKRKARNAEIRRTYHDAVREWEAERDAAKSESRRARWTKPKQGKLEKGAPRPKKPEFGDSEEELDGDEDEEDVEDDNDDD